MNQETRILLAIVLSVLIFVGYNHFFPQPLKPVPVATQNQKVTSDDNSPATLTPAPASAVQPAITTADPTFTGEDKDILIETPKTKIVLSTKGGKIKSYELKDYKSAPGSAHAFKDILAETPDSFALGFGLKGYAELPEQPLYKVAEDQTIKGARRIVLLWQDNNVRVERTFVFGGPDSAYAIRHKYNVTSRVNTPFKVTPYIEHRLHQKPQKKTSGFLSFLKFEQPDDFGSTALKNDDSLTTQAVWSAFKDAPMQSDIHWAGITDRYFLIAGFSDQSGPLSVEFKKQGDFLVANLFSKDDVLVPGSALTQGLVSYIGPKKMGDLAVFPVGLTRAIDYGWFDFVARPILWLMTFFHRFVPNWGLVIILLTFFVKMCLHPVNKKSMTSMKAMQLLQPKLKEIQKRHKDDRLKMNEEVMQLFKTHKVNPMGGCLPMVLQMPIYIALYKVLWNAIELYHSPFLYYSDLSAPDPYFISPVILGVFMFLQQKLTPSPSMDPAQQKVMMLMPIMFTLFMLFLPVGLVIYIFVNTAMSVVQQYMMQHDISFRDVLRGKWRVHGAV